MKSPEAGADFKTSFASDGFSLIPESGQNRLNSRI
jgi:hypothetical protein